MRLSDWHVAHFFVWSFHEVARLNRKLGLAAAVVVPFVDHLLASTTPVHDARFVG